MAIKNITRDANNFSKKSYSVSVVYLNEDNASSVDNLKALVLPKDVLVTRVTVVIKKPTQAGVTLDIGIDGALDILGAAVALETATSLIQTVAPLNKYVEKTTPILFTPSAPFTQGLVSIVIEYVELSLDNGQLTQVMYGD